MQVPGDSHSVQVVRDLTDSASSFGNSLFYSLTVPSKRARARVFERIRLNDIQSNLHQTSLSVVGIDFPSLPGIAPSETLAVRTVVPDHIKPTSVSDYERVLATVSEVGAEPQVLAGVAKDQVVVNFNFWSWEDFLQHERYLKRARPLFTRLPFPYFWIPPAVRNFLLRCLAASRGNRAAAPGDETRFPAWPVEPSLDSLRRVIWTAAAGLAGVELDPAPYPGKRRLVCLLTHDVDTGAGLDAIEPIRRVERRLGVPSAWSFVSKRYRTPDPVLHRLIEEGCEVVSHGYLHDGRLPYLNPAAMRRRLGHLFEVHPWLRTHVHGVRSGQTLRSNELLSVMAESFDYDSTFPDTERDGPYGAASGCCTVFPFRTAARIVEIPLTIPQDFYLLFVHRTGLPGLLAAWQQKLDYIAGLQGCAGLILHPEHVLHDPDLLATYERFLEYLLKFDAWVATPFELLQFYRNREAND